MGLVHLARRAPGQMVMLEEISRQEKIPRSFLAKIFQDLAKNGFVRSNRGAGGGFALARSASEISVLEIIEAIEGKIVFQRCKLDQPDCEHKGTCALCGLFEKAQDGVTDVLAQTTLLALASQPEEIAAAPPSRRSRRRRA